MNTTTSKKNKAFTVADRTLFDIVATRDLTALKNAIDSDSDAVVSARDRHGYSLLHVAAANGHLDVCKAFLGINEPQQPQQQHRNDQQQSAINSAAATTTTAAVSNSAAAADGSGSGGNSTSAAKSPSRSGSRAGGRKGGVVEATAGGAKGAEQKREKEREEKLRLAGNNTLHPSQLPVPVQLPTVHMNVDATSDCGYTPLHIATMRGSLAIVQLLLSCGADPKAVTTRVASPVEPLTAYQLARKYHFPAIEHVLEPLTFSEKKNVIPKDGSRDAAEAYVDSVSPIAAAKEGDVLYFSLALLDCCGGDAGGAVVDEARYAFGLKTLKRIRTAKCPETGKNALMMVLDREELSEPYRLIASLLIEQVVFVRKSGRKAEDSFESVFVHGPRYPDWQTYRVGYTFPTGPDGNVIKPKLRSDAILAARRKRQLEKERLAAEGGEEGEEEEDGDKGDADGSDANNTTAPHNDTNVGEVEEAEEDENAMDVDGSAIYSVNASNTVTDGSTALHYAFRHGHEAIAKKLIVECGADCTIGDTYQQLARDVMPAAQLAQHDEHADQPLTATAGSLRDVFAEAYLRKTFLDLFNKRDDVYPDDRPPFMEHAKRLKRKWRDADKLLRGEPVVKKEHADEDDGDDLGRGSGYDANNVTGTYAGTTAPSSPQREHNDADDAEKGEEDES